MGEDGVKRRGRLWCSALPRARGGLEWVPHMRGQQARYEKQQAEQHAKIDREFAAIQKLITIGMKVIVRETTISGIWPPRRRSPRPNGKA